MLESFALSFCFYPLDYHTVWPFMETFGMPQLDTISLANVHKLHHHLYIYIYFIVLRQAVWWKCKILSRKVARWLCLGIIDLNLSKPAKGDWVMELPSLGKEWHFRDALICPVQWWWIECCPLPGWSTWPLRIHGLHCPLWSILYTEHSCIVTSV